MPPATIPASPKTFSNAEGDIILKSIIISHPQDSEHETQETGVETEKNLYPEKIVEQSNTSLDILFTFSKFSLRL